MLILSRKPGDAIVIAGGIRIVVLESDRRGVRLGIEAPAEVSILREEIVTAIADENRRANTIPEASEWAQILPVRPRKSP
jgi:carbon storage regulator